MVARARPKSQIFKSQLLLTKRFLGFLENENVIQIRLNILDLCVKFSRSANTLIHEVFDREKIDNAHLLMVEET